MTDSIETSENDARPYQPPQPIAASDLVHTPVPMVAKLQPRVQPWLMACFGPLIAGDREERNHRFLEEAVELVQAGGCDRSEAHQLVDYVYDRPAGEMAQEVGGVMITLAALCLANGLDMHEAGETELTRIWTKVEAIRAKQAAKPKHSPLPQHVAPGDEITDEQIVAAWQGMPGGPDAWLKQFGFLQFARRVLELRPAQRVMLALPVREMGAAHA